MHELRGAERRVTYKRGRSCPATTLVGRTAPTGLRLAGSGLALVAGCGAIGQQQHVGPGVTGVHQLEVGRGEAFGKEPFAVAEYDGMNHEAVLVDQVVLGEGADQSGASGEENVAVVALLEPAH